MRTSRGTAALAAAAVVLAAGCGRGEEAAPPATTTPETTVANTTTTTGNEDELKKLLLVAADVPEFKEKPASNEPEDDFDPFARCEAELPALKAVADAPEVEGASFVRAPEDAVEVGSSATATTPEKAEALLNELADPKTGGCFETAFSEALKKEVPAGAEVTPKVTATKSSVAGADQTVLLSIAATVRGGGQTSTFRADLVFLRRAGDVVIVTYSGPTNLTSVAERQRIVAAVSKKLGGGTTATTAGSASTSSTRGGSSTTRRSTTTTRGGTTSSRATTTSTTG